MRNSTNLETHINQYNALKQALKPPKGMARSKTFFPHLILNPSLPNFSLFLQSLHFLSCT